MAGRESTEPKVPRDGKVFHPTVQDDWQSTAKGDVRVEKPTKKAGQRAGRMDIFVSENGREVRAIVEIKHSDWDRMKPDAVRRNAKRQARQIWRCIKM